MPEWVKEQLKKNGKSWNAPWQNDSPAGFVSRFAPKFTPLLREKYPDDNPRQILARLENMWNKGHVCQTNFGIRCEKFCTCKDGWRSVFHEGDMDNATSSRNNKRISKCASSDLVASAIPRKRSRTDVPVTNDAEKKTNSFGARYESYVGMQQSARKKESAAPLHRNPSPSEENKSYIDKHGEKTHRERTENTRSDARLSSEMNGLNDTNREAVLWPFCLCFRSFLPLGFYCITAESESRGSTCKITSVSLLCPYHDIFIQIIRCL